MCFSFQYKESPEAFAQTARHWAQAYAGVNRSMPELESKIRQLLDMGFDEVRIDTYPLWKPYCWSQALK